MIPDAFKIVKGLYTEELRKDCSFINLDTTKTFVNYDGQVVELVEKEKKSVMEKERKLMIRKGKRFLPVVKSLLPQLMPVYLKEYYLVGPGIGSNFHQLVNTACWSIGRQTLVKVPRTHEELKNWFEVRWGVFGVLFKSKDGKLAQVNRTGFIFG